MSPSAQRLPSESDGLYSLVSQDIDSFRVSDWMDEGHNSGGHNCVPVLSKSRSVELQAWSKVVLTDMRAFDHCPSTFRAESLTCAKMHAVKSPSSHHNLHGFNDIRISPGSTPCSRLPGNTSTEPGLGCMAQPLSAKPPALVWSSTTVGPADWSQLRNSTVDRICTTQACVFGADHDSGIACTHKQCFQCYCKGFFSNKERMRLHRMSSC